jgi:hypothetical protein
LVIGGRLSNKYPKSPITAELTESIETTRTRWNEGKASMPRTPPSHQFNGKAFAAFWVVRVFWLVSLEMIGKVGAY